MLTPQPNRVYSDFPTTKFNGEILLTPENAARVTSRGSWSPSSTYLINTFLSDKKDYLAILIGHISVNYEHFNIYAVLERRLSGMAPNSAIPFSSLFPTRMIIWGTDLDFLYGTLTKRTQRFYVSILSCLKRPYTAGLYSIHTERPIIKAQTTDDRYGFGKTHLYNKPYGYCSEAFELAAVYLEEC